MHPVTFIYKIKRRLRRKSEQFCPKLFFLYGNEPSDPDRFFEQFLNVVPFLPMVNLKERLSDLEQRELIQKADAICDHTFDLLGSGPYHFENGIDWHLDFKSGSRWPEDAVHSLCRPQTGADIKIPWELSRFNHAVTLGLAFHLSNDWKVAEEFIRQVEDWIDKNPVGYGVNWACCMDVSIRAVNWLTGFSLLSAALMKEEFSGFRQKLFSNLWKHARFIWSHLEWLGPKEEAGANHFLSDLTGLLTLGLFFRQTKKGGWWLRFAHEEIEHQMTRQVFLDGVHFECSLSYHRLCLEMFMWCGSLAQRSNRSFSGGYDARLQKMQQFVADYMKPSGVAPLIGDNDDGQLLNSGLLNMSDHRYVQPAREGGEFFIDRFLLDGSTAVKFEPSIQSASYPDGGFYFLKNERVQVCVRAGQLAHAGAHAHNDQLSFELTLDGKDIFVDRGSYLYTSDPESRNQYRSTAAHNVMQVNGAEQNRLGFRLFGMIDETQTKVLKVTGRILEAEHMGFREFEPPGLKHSRRVELDEVEPKLTLVDDGIGGLREGDRLSWMWHLASGLMARVEGNRVCIAGKRGDLCDLHFPSEVKASVQEFPHSPSYGVLETAQVVVMECRVGGNDATYHFEMNWEGK